MLKIYFISTSIIPSKTASSINVMKMSEAFSKIGNIVELAAFGSNKTCNKTIFKSYDVEQNFVLKKFKRNKLYYLLTPIIAKVKKIDLVYTRHPLIAYFCSLLKIDVIFHGHGVYTSKRHIRLLRKLQNNKHVKAICVVSHGLMNYYMDTYQMGPKKMVMISNGVDYKRVNRIFDSKRIKSQSRINSDEKIIVYSGSLYEGRGIEIIIQMSRLLKEHRFVIVGGTELEILKWNEKDNENILFVGYVENSKVPEYLSIADYLVMPYQEEVQVVGGIAPGDLIRPLKLFEYLITKKPIIASDLVGLREVLGSSNSVLVKHNDANEWVDAIKLLDSNKALSESIALEAYESGIKYLTTEITKEIISLLTSNEN